MKRFVRRFLAFLPILYGLFIWWQSSQFNPESVVELTYLIGNKLVAAIGMGLELAHLVEFGLLYLFIVLAVLNLGHELTKENAFVAFYLSIAYGLIDEVHQSFVPFRSLSIIDFVKDIIGVAVVWLVVRYFYKKSDSKIGFWLRSLGHSSRKSRKGINI